MKFLAGKRAKLYDMGGITFKHTRSKVRKALPPDFSYIIEELITERAEVHDKEGYYNEIIHIIIRIGRAQEFIIALGNHDIVWMGAA